MKQKALALRVLFVWLALVAITSAAMYWPVLETLTAFNLIRPATEARMLGIDSPEALLNWMATSNREIAMRRFSAWEQLCFLAEDPANRDVIRSHRLDPDLRGTYANMVLFRVGDCPDARLSRLLKDLEQDSLHRVPFNDPRYPRPHVIGFFLMRDLTPAEIREHETLLRQYLGSTSPSVRQLIDSVLNGSEAFMRPR